MKNDAERWTGFHFVLVAAIIALFLAAVLMICTGCTIATFQVGKVLRLSLDASLTWPAKVDLLPAEPAENNVPSEAPNTPPDIPPGASMPPGWTPQ